MRLKNALTSINAGNLGGLKNFCVFGISKIMSMKLN